MQSGNAGEDDYDSPADGWTSVAGWEHGKDGLLRHQTLSCDYSLSSACTPSGEQHVHAGCNA